MKRVHIIAADLDPHGVLESNLSKRAEHLGVRLTFLRGDLTDQIFRRRLEEFAPFDLALFIGLSSWLPKPDTLAHLTWLGRNLRADGRLVTDCFTPEAYALSGRYIGYKANYYAPEVYRAMLDYCGFDGLTAEIASGRDRINHVLVAALGRDQSDKQLRLTTARQQFMGNAGSPLPLEEGQSEGLVRTSADLVFLPFHTGSR